MNNDKIYLNEDLISLKIEKEEGNVNYINDIYEYSNLLLLARERGYLTSNEEYLCALNNFFQQINGDISKFEGYSYVYSNILKLKSELITTRNELLKELVKKNNRISDKYNYNLIEFFDFDRNLANKCIKQNQNAIRIYKDEMRKSLNVENYEAVAKNAFIYSYFAQEKPQGFYCDLEVEKMLLDCAEKLDQPAVTVSYHYKKQVGKRKVLHILSEGYSVGGHTRLVKNWVKNDQNTISSLITTWQISSTPNWLIDEIVNSGGFYYDLGAYSASFIERAKLLRKIASEWAEVIVVHSHMHDPIPILAFGVTEIPNIIFMNHADHLFWLGATIADCVISIRDVGMKICKGRRGIKNNYILPIPLDTKQSYNKDDIKEQMGLNKDYKVILTIASEYKFKSINKNHYALILKEIIEKTYNTIAFVIGPENKDMWKVLSESTNGRIRILGILDNIEDYYKAADFYLDSFMISSATSILDAALYGIDVITYKNNIKTLYLEYSEFLKECEFSSVEDIVNYINSGGDKVKVERIKQQILNTHNIDINDKIEEIYKSLTKHEVKKDLTIDDNILDLELFWALLKE